MTDATRPPEDDLIEETDNGPRPEDGDQPDDMQEPGTEREDLV